MRISNFIVVDDYKRIKNGSTFLHSVNGTVIYPLETPLPIIQKGNGCIGIGMISEIVMSSSSTRITFTVSKVNSDDADAYYRLYQNQVSVSNDTDGYDVGADMVIPGMMASQPKVTKRGYDSPRPKSRSLSDFMRDNGYD